MNKTPDNKPPFPVHPQLEALQTELSGKVKVSGDGLYVPNEGDCVMSLDIQYKGEDAHVAGTLTAWGEGPLGTWAGVAKADFPYIPGYFCFREGPPLLALVMRMLEEELPKPRCLIIDGHGIAHPRLFGVACWMGLALGLPAVGCAKETLVRFSEKPEATQGSWSEVRVEGECVGAVVRTQDGINPVFVSPGHLIDLATSRMLVLGLGGSYKVPDPLRFADYAARAHSRGEEPVDWVDLGALEGVKPYWEQGVMSV